MLTGRLRARAEERRVKKRKGGKSREKKEKTRKKEKTEKKTNTPVAALSSFQTHKHTTHAHSEPSRRTSNPYLTYRRARRQQLFPGLGTCADARPRRRLQDSPLLNRGIAERTSRPSLFLPRSVPHLSHPPQPSATALALSRPTPHPSLPLPSSPKACVRCMPSDASAPASACPGLFAHLSQTPICLFSPCYPPDIVIRSRTRHLSFCGKVRIREEPAIARPDLSGHNGEKSRTAGADSRRYRGPIPWW